MDVFRDYYSLTMIVSAQSTETPQNGEFKMQIVGPDLPYGACLDNESGLGPTDSTRRIGTPETRKPTNPT